MVTGTARASPLRGVAFSRGHWKDVSRDTQQTRTLGIAEERLSESLQRCLWGAPEFPESSRQQSTVFRIWPRQHHRLESPERRFSEWLQHWLLELCWTIASGVAKHHHRWGQGEHHFWGRCTILVRVAKRISASPGVVPYI